MPPRETVAADYQEAGSVGAEHDGTLSIPVTGQPGVPTCPSRRARPWFPAARIRHNRPAGRRRRSGASAPGRTERMGRQTAEDAERTARSAPSTWRITFQARIVPGFLRAARRFLRSGPGPRDRFGCERAAGVISAFAACHLITEPGDAV